MSGVESSQVPQDAFDHASESALEPVNFTGLIQPYGVLIALSNPELTLLQVSANVQDYLGVSPESLLHQPLATWLDAATIAKIEQALSHGHSKTSLRICQGEQDFNATLYQTAAAIILELELTHAQLDDWYVQAHSHLKQAITQLRQVTDLVDFLQLAAAEIRQITGFDRVLIYRFDAQKAGAVVAEATRDACPLYLGLHYPATDIPEIIRALYQQGFVRYIPDITAPSVELLPAHNPITQQPLDLSMSGMRSVDPCCVDYHRNMGVAAMLVIPLIQGETLWGLMSCHHPTPQSIPYEVRELCELLGQLIASELTNKVNTEELNYLTKLRSLQSDFIQSIAQIDDLQQALIHPAPRLLDLVSAQGAAVCLEDEITLVGNTPSLEQVRALLQWLDTYLHSSSNPSPLFQTHSLPQIYAQAKGFKTTACGLLVLQISQVQRYTILWFRPEVLQTVNWAGNPHPALTVAADGNIRLCPRQSFERWQEVVHLTALPWQPCELENALDLRNAIVGIVLKKANQLARINQELECSNRELDSFAYAASHDLKEPLRGIHNYSKLLLKGYAHVLDEVGQSRLQTLIRLTRRMEVLIDTLLKFSRLGQTELRLQITDLNQSVNQVLEDLAASHPDFPTDIRMARPWPAVHCDAVLIQEVLVNLISNAIKYNDKPERWIELGYLERGTDRPYTFYVRDNGIGIRERHQDSIFRLFKRLHEQHLYGGGTGAGLTIAQKIIERHGGRIWVESTYGEGSTVYFTLT